ncbi:MAG TPA: patatin-like phospholipase family protein, partial [Pyrinomonadaceae bacterium]|nr:patatin-like phospholipase family protein [Pyrinomonadaceae bacterium]
MAEESGTATSPTAECVPLDLADVLAEELKETRPAAGDVDRDDLDGVFHSLHSQELTALCFSGGGIRSATFGLGIIQALAKHELLTKFDYLSTVSGGGYLGCWLSAWVCREHKNRGELADREFGIRKVQENINCRETPEPGDPNPEPAELQHLREYSNYMSPRTGLLTADSWTLVAIYLRNLFLTLLISVPLLTAALMVPRFLFKATVQVEPTPQAELLMLIFAVALGSFAVAFVISRLPSKTHDEDMPAPATRWEHFKAFLNTDAGVLVFGVMPLAVAAFLASTLFGWKYAFGSRLDDYYVFSSSFWGLIDPALGYFLAVSAAAYFIGLLIFFIIKFRKAERDLAAGFAAFGSSLIGGLFLWIVAFKLFPFALEFIVGILEPSRSERLIWQLFLTFSVPVFLLIVLVTASIYVGLTSRTATDEDREWLARYGAWVVIVGAVWAMLSALVLIGPTLLQWIFRIQWTEIFSLSGIPAIVSSIAAVVSGAIALLGGYSEQGLVRDEPVKSRASKILAYAPRIAAGLFLVFIFVGIAYLASWINFKSGISGLPTFDHVTILQETSVYHLTILFVVLAAFGLLMACFVNVNKFSLHGAYRDRLVRAYLGASHEGRKQNTFTGFDDNDNLELHELSNQKPLHVINATVNLVGGKNLAWQNRKAASFTMSSLHCGSWAVKGYRHSRDYCRSSTSGKALRLGTAMAISGAAANPNMGYYSSSVVTFLMSLFNIRLGWWLGNTG